MTMTSRALESGDCYPHLLEVHPKFPK